MAVIEISFTGMFFWGGYYRYIVYSRDQRVFQQYNIVMFVCYNKKNYAL